VGGVDSYLKPSSLTNPNPPADAQWARLYRALCTLLSGQTGQVDWDTFTPSDWDLLARMAQGEGVAPLLHSILEQHESGGQPGIAAIPTKEKTRLAQSYYANAAYTAVLCRELDGVLAALTEAGVPVILLKGAALIKTLYTDPAVRPMNDLDLLVRRFDIPRAVRALQAGGFQRLMDNYIRYHVFMLGGQSGQTSVELHWSLVLNDQRFPELIDWFWSQSQPLEASNPRVGVLSPMAEMLYLAAHLGLQHKSQGRLIWWYDLYLLLNNLGEHIEWDALLLRASQAGWAETLQQSLSGVEERFGYDLPAGFLRRLQQQAAAQPGQAGSMVGSSSDRRPGLGVKAWTALSWSDRLRMAWGLLFPRPAYLRWRYHPRPGWLWPLWYVRRWVDMVVDGVETEVLDNMGRI
jgi:hypothetical protein